MGWERILMINKLKDNWKHLMFMLAIPAVSSFYPLFNNAKNGAQMVFTPLDYRVPFIKEFIIAYIIWYPFIILTMVYLCLKDKRVYYRTLASLILGFLASFTIFYVFQTHVPRPEVVGDDIFSKLVRLIYSGDQPYNCFPSLHVLESHLMVMGVNALENKSKKLQYFMVFTSVMIILSTQFVKQHVVIDIIGGLYLAEVIFNAIPGMKRVLLTMFKRRAKVVEN